MINTSYGISRLQFSTLFPPLLRALPLIELANFLFFLSSLSISDRLFHSFYFVRVSIPSVLVHLSSAEHIHVLTLSPSKHHVVQVLRRCSSCVHCWLRYGGTASYRCFLGGKYQLVFTLTLQLIMIYFLKARKQQHKQAVTYPSLFDLCTKLIGSFFFQHKAGANNNAAAATGAAAAAAPPAAATAANATTAATVDSTSAAAGVQNLTAQEAAGMTSFLSVLDPPSLTSNCSP